MTDPTAQAHPPRICHGCHKDCSHKARLKDPAGHYWCKECFEKADALEKERAAKAHAAHAAAPVALKKPAAAVSTPAAAGAPDDAPLILTEDSTTNLCIACRATMEQGATFCSLCGAAQRPTSGAMPAVRGRKAAKPPRVAKGPSTRILNSDEYATFWRRFGAQVIDNIIVGIMVGPLRLIVVSSGGADLGTAKDEPESMTPSALWYWVVVYGIAVGYGTLTEGLMGATPGKKALGMLVGRSDSSELGLLGALARNLAKTFISMPLFIGGFVGIIEGLRDRDGLAVVGCLVVMGLGIVPFALNVMTPKRQALHDLMAGSMVVR